MAGSRTEANVVLRHQCVKLRQKSSIIQFRIAPSSTHRQIWMNETLPETKTPITGNPVEINEEIFVGDNDITYEVISNMLSTASVLVDVLAREKIILEIIAKGLALVYAKYFSGVKTKLLIEVEIHVVTTHGPTQEFEAEFNGCGFPAIKRLKVGGCGQD